MALVAGVIYMYKKFEWFRDGVNAIWSFIKKIFSFSPLGLIINHWSAITGFFSNFWDNLKAGFSKGIEFIANIFVAPVKFIKKGWDAILGWITSKIKWITSIASKIKGFFGFGDDKKELNIKNEEKKEIKIPKFKAPNVSIPTTSPKEAVAQRQNIQTTTIQTNSVSASHNYNININVTGANPNEIIDKIKVILPHLIEEIEENRRQRALSDTV